MSQQKKNSSCLLIQLAVGVALLTACILFVLYGPVFPASLDPVEMSHVVANVPNKSDFDPFLKRDLGRYFTFVKGREITVDYELLREWPTQVGVALPKYYLWVRLYESGNLLEEGAVRVAAADKSRFDVLNYLSENEIETNTEIINKVFPQEVCDRIKEKTR